MKKLLFFLLLLSAGPALASAPEDSLRALLTERDRLVKDYQYYNAQNSNFWGKKSKKDLLRLIDTLKEIIRQDSEIINAVRAGGLQRAAEVTVQKTRLEEQVKNDNVSITDNIYQLKTRLASLENLQKVRQRQINQLQAEVETVRRTKTDRDKLILLAGFSVAGLLLYIINLRRRLNRLGSRK